MAGKSNLKQIRLALSTGRLSVVDPTTGYHHSFCACCPADGHDSSVYRTDRSGQAITRVVFRCSVCGRQFDAGPKAISLR